MEDPAESERAFARHSRHSHDAEHEERASHDGIAQVRESVHHLADGLDTVKALVVQLIEVQQAQHGPGGRRSPTGRIDSALSAASPRWAEEAFWHSPTKAPAAAPAAAEELVQRGGHELLHRVAELLTRARGISDDRSPRSRGASYGAGGGAVDGGGGGGVSGDGSGGGCGSSAAAVEASASAAEAASHAAEGEEAAAPAGGRRFTLSDPMAC